jgi:hypothetical protein
MAGGACSKDKILVLTAEGILWVWRIKAIEDVNSVHSNNTLNHPMNDNTSGRGRLSSPTRSIPKIGGHSPNTNDSRGGRDSPYSRKTRRVVELELREDISHIRSVDFVGFKDSDSEGNHNGGRQP